MDWLSYYMTDLMMGNYGVHETSRTLISAKRRDTMILNSGKFIAKGLE
jgi:hypothetical protein